MNRFLDRYLNVQADDILVARRGRLLNVLVLVMSIADLLTMLVDIIRGQAEFLGVVALALIVFGAIYWFTRRGHYWPPYVFLAFMTLVLPYSFRENLNSPLVMAIVTPVVIAPLITAPWLCIPVSVVEAVMLFALSFTLGYPLPNPLVVVILGALGTISWLSSWTLENAFQEARRNALALAGSNRELEASHTLLEKHARELERRSAYLQASAQVSQTVTSILETQKLIQQVVELVRQRLDLYYVGLFLVDETGEWAVLQAGTGETGQTMLAQGYRLKVGGNSMIGWCIANKQARIALDISQDTVRLAVAELPDTRSEAALPLRVHDRVLGALTVQSSQPGTFDQETASTLQTLADQIAVALDNARLFAEAQAALEATRRAYGEISQEAWAVLNRTRPDLAYRSDAHGLTSARGVWRPEMEQAVHRGEVAKGNGTDAGEKRPLAVPIKVRGNVIGVLDTFKSRDDGDWTLEEVTILEALTNQVGLALENARLYQDTQRRAAREQLTGEVTARMRESLDIETVLKTAVNEIARALGLAALDLRLSMGTELAGDRASRSLIK